MSNADGNVKAYGAPGADKPLGPMAISRREVGPDDVKIDILYCGLCHSDIHQARNEWASTLPTAYPCVPGHEIVGRVAAVGKNVKKHKVGDLVGVGCLVDSCKHCDACDAGLENYCDAPVYTYNGPTADAPGHTLGGYSQRIVVRERFVLKIKHPENRLAAVAPLLCAGVTTYSPMKRWKVGKGTKVGIVGIGGLGHMGVKLANALGAEVYAITHSESKKAEAKRLGAHEVVFSRSEESMKKIANRLDFILDTVAAPHDLGQYLPLLRLDGAMVMVGLPAKPHPQFDTSSLLYRRRALSGSMIGGIPETQEVLDFCAERNIVADIEMVEAKQINEAYERMIKGDVKYRFVLDSATLQ